MAQSMVDHSYLGMDAQVVGRLVHRGSSALSMTDKTKMPARRLRVRWQVFQAIFDSQITGETPPPIEISPRHGNQNRDFALNGFGDQRPTSAAFAFGLAELVDDEQIGHRRKRVACPRHGAKQGFDI